MTDFRTIALALRDHISDTYALIAAADAVVAVLPEPATAIDDGYLRGPEGLAAAKVAALSSPEALTDIREGKRLSAIKVVRSMANVGLVEARDAVDSTEVQNLVRFISRCETDAAITSGLNTNPWDNHHDSDEPPF